MKRKAPDSDQERPKKRQKQEEEVYSFLFHHLEQGQTNEQCIAHLIKDYPDFPRAGIEDKLNELRQTLSGVPPNSFEQPILILKDEDVVPAFIEQPIDPQPKKVLKEKPASLNLPKVNDFWNSGKILGCYFEQLEMNRLTKRDIDELGLQHDKLSLHEEDGFLLFVIATCLFRLGKAQDSQKYFDVGFEKLRNSEKTTNNLLSLACICQHYKNFDEAKQYFEAASQTARMAVSNAQFGLYCVDNDPTTSIYHLHEASDNGNSHAQFELGRLYSGDPPLIEKNESLQSKYIELAAQQGHQLANYTLGCEYYYGNEFEIAYSHFEEALVGGDVGSHYYLGEMYFLGQGVVVDYNKALEHLLKAIPQKNTKPIAYHHIGEIYFFLKDYANAFNFLSEAVGRDQKEANYSLGQCYHFGLGIPIDLPSAISCYQQSSDHRSFHALGDIYCSLNELNLAIHCYMQALEKNHDYIPTVKALAELYWKQNNYDMGLLHYQTLAKLDPSVDYAQMEKRAREERTRRPVRAQPVDPRPTSTTPSSSNGIGGLFQAGFDVVNEVLNNFFKLPIQGKEKDTK